MFHAASLPDRSCCALLNDCGPELEKAGLDRIRDYIGVGGSQPTWMHAARAYAELNGAIYPAYGIHDWLRLTKRTHRLTPEGRSEEHTSELQSLMRISYAVFCLKKKNRQHTRNQTNWTTITHAHKPKP